MAINIHGSACILWSLLLLTVPFPWLISSLIAALYHELWHYAVIRLSRGHVHTIQIKARGASMETQPMPPMQELLCALAGPVGSLSLLLLLRIFPRIALCAAIQGVFNLLPVYPLDGGRAIRCALCLLQEKFLAKKRISGYNSATIENEVLL